jgi:hypothetical protein
MRGVTYHYATIVDDPDYQRAVLRYEIARDLMLLKAKKLQRLLDAKANFNPNQPRVPAGSGRESGRWTDAGGSSAFGAGSSQSAHSILIDTIRRARLSRDGEIISAQFVAGSRKYAPVLEDEEINGGHALEEHVYKSEAEALALVQKDKYNILGFVIDRWRGEGLFLSRESANDYVNRVLEENQETVDLVASGQQQEASLIKRFGSVTGKEAYRPDSNSDPYIRKTYEVRVEIRHNPNRERGYTVITAYPMNRNRE